VSLALSLLGEALAISRELGDKWSLATALANLGVMIGYGEDKDHTTARRYLNESLALYRELGDKSRITYTLSAIGFLAYLEGDHISARPLYEEVLADQEELGDKASIAESIDILGDLAYMRGDYESAASYHERSLALARELGDKWTTADAMYNLGQVARRQGSPRIAFEYLTQSLVLRYEHERLRGVAQTLGEVAGLLSDLGDPLYTQEGARLLGAAEAIWETNSKPAIQKWRVDYDRNMDTVRSRLGETKFAEGIAEGWTLSVEQAIELAGRPRTLPEQLPGLVAAVSTEGKTAHKAQKPPSRLYAQPQEDTRSTSMPFPDSAAATGATKEPDSEPALTEREAEVLRLLAAGKSNPQIAEELFLSVKTVETHLRSVYKKLGVASRSEAALYAMRRGFV
jgi:ATP/maltotriose-dependent transcriptional regulator MalT